MALLRMRRPPHAAILLFLICIVLYAYGPFQERKLSSFPLSHNGRIQDSFYGTQRGGQRVEKERMQTVKEEFQHSWKGYKSRAWMFDELRPVSGGNYTKLCGWAATLVDSLDTLYIMGLEDEWKEAVDAVLTLDFATLSWSCNVNVFEMTIRHLGGMIAAYDIDGSRDKRLLDKSVEVGEMLFNAFNTTNGLQCSFFEWPK
jgi:mannosyl-oligosaccharide alpha-1,2-mannosidase